jgi:hypothetical protein
MQYDLCSLAPNNDISFRLSELPFAVWYSLPGYEFEGLELPRLENGMIDTKKPFESATWMLETNVRDHKLPLIGPANAKRIMFKFLLIGEPVGGRTLRPAFR